ncbi:MAG: NUDIX domain-containing protein [bacterium]
MDITHFNIRVYGLLIDEGRILVTDEYRLGIFMTKFPGGGLRFGEGTIDCLKREFLEELKMPVEIISHFYTTDFFQPTILLPSKMQLISIYYRVKAGKPYPFKVTEKKNDFWEIAEGAQNFRWIKIPELTEEEMTLPVDKAVVRMLKETIKK